MRLNTGANSFDANFSILAGTRSGPDAFAGLRLLSSFSMPGAVNSMSGIGETGSPSMSGRCPSGSLVNCEVYCEFRASATSVGSLKRFPSDLRTGILLWPDFFCFMYE